MKDEESNTFSQLTN